MGSRESSFLPGRGRSLLVVGVVDDQGGVDVDVQPVPGNGGGASLPGRRSGCCPGHTHPRSPVILAPAARCVTFVDAQVVQHRA